MVCMYQHFGGICCFHHQGSQMTLLDAKYYPYIDALGFLQSTEKLLLKDLVITTWSIICLSWWCRFISVTNMNNRLPPNLELISYFLSCKSVPPILLSPHPLIKLQKITLCHNTGWCIVRILNKQHTLLIVGCILPLVASYLTGNAVV